ncbi:MAG: hypothetical protein IT288_02950 [Bdellovibrionales bacterium]|nr:hypothetical protein [Bdellovibrionales bacterium]
MFKAFIASLIVLGGLSAQAQDLQPWEAELQAYEAKVPQMSSARLALAMTGQTTKLIAACSADAVVVMASFVMDTLPVANLVSEGITNLVDKNYETLDFESWLSFAAAGQLGRGVAGGGVAAILESAEFLFLWLAGEEERSYEAVKKMYASSFATVNALFAQKGACMMSFAKLVILGNELEERRQNQPLGDDQFISNIIAP